MFSWEKALTAFTELLVPGGLPLVAIVVVLLWMATIGEASQIKSDEQVVLFPVAAHLRADGRTWIVPLHGWVFESERDDLLRRAALGQLGRTLGLGSDVATSELFKRRAAPFLVDNERAKWIQVQIAGQVHKLQSSEANGHCYGSVLVDAQHAREYAQQGRLTVEVVLPPGDLRAFRGVVHLIQPTGISVISDIDDTIKVSEVLDKRKLLYNTFCQPFAAVEGMAQRYRQWADAGLAFHYVSSSPWQLYEPLASFLSDTGFPEGSLDLRLFRIKDRTVLNLGADSLTTKPPVIEQLLQAYPERRFILVGDSGEWDPEVYALIARKYPAQILRIFIRDVTGEPADATRYTECFRDLPAELWQLFDDPQSMVMP